MGKLPITTLQAVPPSRMDSGSHKSGYLHHVFGDLQYTLGTPFIAEIVRWWEARRPRYNVLVGSVGIVTWLLVLCVGSLAVKPGVDFEEPIMMIIGPIIYGACANLCFTLGWIVDTSLYRGRPRNRLWKQG
jgi:hypothetical protein